MLPFCSGPILITLCLRSKDTRLSTRYIFAFWESLGTRLSLVHTASSKLFGGNLGTSLCGIFHLLMEFFFLGHM